MGEDMKMGLSKLGRILTDIPNMPYDKMTVPLSPPKVVELPAEDVLVISSGTLVNDISDVWLSVKKNNEWILENLTRKDHIRGALKAYRKACFVQIGKLKPSMGWDTIDELLAKFYGWELLTDETLQVKHPLTRYTIFLYY